METLEVMLWPLVVIAESLFWTCKITNGWRLLITFTLQVYQPLLQLMGTIPTEIGLDAQNYQCKGCSRPVGICVSFTSCINNNNINNDNDNDKLIHWYELFGFIVQ